MAARKKIVAIRTFQRYRAWAIRTGSGRLLPDVYAKLNMARDDCDSRDSRVVRVEVTVRVIERKAR